jgi:hypothetical protein
MVGFSIIGIKPSGCITTEFLKKTNRRLTHINPAPISSVVLEKLTVTQQVKKIPTLCATKVHYRVHKSQFNIILFVPIHPNVSLPFTSTNTSKILYVVLVSST